MSAIDEGAPTLSSRVSATFTVANMSTAVRAWLWDQNYGGLTDEDISVYFESPTGIHNQTQMKSGGPTLDAAHLALNLHLLNPIGYYNKKLTAVLTDLIVEQAHAGHGRIRIKPNSDAGVNAWFRSAGSAPHYTYIDDFVDDPGAGTVDHLFTTSNASEERFGLPALPGSATQAVETVVSFLGSLMKGPPGSDNGLAFQFKIAHATSGDLTRTLYADMYANGTLGFRAVKFDNMAVIPSVWSGAYLSMKSARGSAGASPNPRWTVWALEVTIYFESNEPAYRLVNDASFSALDAACPYTLDFDIIEANDYYEAVLDVLGHGPEYFLYLDYRGQLSMGKVQNYATATPIDISDIIVGVSKGPYQYRERTARAVELRWEITIPHKTGATATEDPTNPPNSRGTYRLRRSYVTAAAAGWGDAKIIDRHFIRSATVAETSALAYLEMWGESPDAVEVDCTWRALEVEPGDVVLVNRPELGLVNRKFTCVANQIDPDSDQVSLVLYDIEFTL